MAVENMVVSTLFEQLKSEGAELESEKKVLEQEYKAKSEHFTILQVENHELKEMSRQLSLEVSKGEQQRGELKAEIIEELKKESEESVAVREKLEKQIAQLFDDNSTCKVELEQLHVANGNLESEVSKLRKEIEEHRVREETLTLELQERSNESELWEAEASSFFFDLQISSIREVLLEKKVHELSEVCASLGDENATKEGEIGQMKAKFVSLECEIEGLKSQLSAYAPAIASLKDNIESLEQNALLRAKLSAAGEDNHKVLFFSLHYTAVEEPYLICILPVMYSC
ncbi:Protein NETWORKED 1A [Linum perenne]